MTNYHIENGYTLSLKYSQQYLYAPVWIFFVSLYYKLNDMGNKLEEGDKSRSGFWNAMKKVGRPRKCVDPDKLWEVACDYFAWCTDNPLYRSEVIKSGDMAGEIINVAIPRPFIWQGLENHLRINGLMAKLDDYRANKDNNYESFSDILACIASIIQEQKYSGALVGTYNPNLIARDLGMSEKSEQTVKVEQPLF